MTKDEKVMYWINLVDSDMAVAEDLFRTKRWLYVAFFCHQSLEKMMKAYWCAVMPNDPPYTHNLIKLSVDSQLATLMSEEQNQFIDNMMPYNIEARYPQYKSAIASGLNENNATYILAQTKDIIQWIKLHTIKES